MLLVWSLDETPDPRQMDIALVTSVIYAELAVPGAGKLSAHLGSQHLALQGAPGEALKAQVRLSPKPVLCVSLLHYQQILYPHAKSTIFIVARLVAEHHANRQGSAC